MSKAFDLTHNTVARDIDRLLNKRELRDALGLASVRTIENLMRRRAIPWIRLGHRSVFFEEAKVRAALAKFELKAVGQ